MLLDFNIYISTQTYMCMYVRILSRNNGLFLKFKVFKIILIILYREVHLKINFEQKSLNQKCLMKLGLEISNKYVLYIFVGIKDFHCVEIGM